MDWIEIKGARENNLKNVNLKIPKNKLNVFTGLSGSGKSSLAFKTIYAEGNRRYIESLSAYARQFLGQMDKPKVDSIEGLSPAIAIDQKTASRNPRSTVGTVTEIHDHLRLLFARIGTPYCPNCQIPIHAQSVDQIIKQILEHYENERIQIIAPVIRGKKGEHQIVFQDLLKQGFVRARVDGEIFELDDEMQLEKNKKHNIEVVIDRMRVNEENTSRITESVELGLKAGNGIIHVVPYDHGNEKIFSQNFSCLQCGFSYEEISPRAFSFNAPYGACSSCHGLGYRQIPDPSKSIFEEKSIEDGAFPHIIDTNYFYEIFKGFCKLHGIDTKIPFQNLPDEKKQLVLQGSPTPYSIRYRNKLGKTNIHRFDMGFQGVSEFLIERLLHKEGYQDKENLFIPIVCPTCHGARLKKEMLSILIQNKNIHEIGELSIQDCFLFFEKNIHEALTPIQEEIAEQILKEITERLRFLKDVGLNYLTLNRNAATLSGGEAQRIRLATQIGSGLTGVLYVLDEPSIGLHQKDNERLLQSLKRLKNLGNTLIVVEHDEDTMKEADYIVDIGPLAGNFGGKVVAQGTYEEILQANTLTADYLSGRKTIAIPKERRTPNGYIEITGARENNLKNINVRFPLGVFIAVSGVSGSGKSTLVNEILYKALAKKLNHHKEKPGEHDVLWGGHKIDKLIDIDQSPIGRTPRSNAATYTKVFDEIRKLFAFTQDAKSKGYQPGRFSFNVPGGRCESCKGDGIVKIEMHLLSDVYVPCEVCQGKRYNTETLRITYKGKNIYEILEMTVDEAVKFFENVPKIKNKLETLKDVGLGYIRLGQSATTLSGGEAQRVKLAEELSKRPTGNTLYILDEPTTGLHTYDVAKLIDILQRLVDKGNSVLVIEHNLDVLKCADHIIDLGPDGGKNGGEVVAQGTPEEIIKVSKSYTGQYLNKVLK